MLYIYIIFHRVTSPAESIKRLGNCTFCSRNAIGIYNPTFRKDPIANVHVAENASPITSINRDGAQSYPNKQIKP